MSFLSSILATSKFTRVTYLLQKVSPTQLAANYISIDSISDAESDCSTYSGRSSSPQNTDSFPMSPYSDCCQLMVSFVIYLSLINFSFIDSAKKFTSISDFIQIIRWLVNFLSSILATSKFMRVTYLLQKVSPTQLAANYISIGSISDVESDCSTYSGRSSSPQNTDSLPISPYSDCCQLMVSFVIYLSLINFSFVDSTKNYYFRFRLHLNDNYFLRTLAMT